MYKTGALPGFGAVNFSKKRNQSQFFFKYYHYKIYICDQL